MERDYRSLLIGMAASLGTILKRLDDPNADGDPVDSIATSGRAADLPITGR